MLLHPWAVQTQMYKTVHNCTVLLRTLQTIESIHWVTLLENAFPSSAILVCKNQPCSKLPLLNSQPTFYQEQLYLNT